MTRFVRFAAVGLLATGIHVGAVYFLVETGGVDPALASLPAFVSALAVSYLLNRRWTFQAAGTGFGPFHKYLLVALGGMLLNAVIMFVAVHIAKASYWLGLAIVVAVVPAVSYLLQRDWTFRRLGGQAE